MAAWERTDLDWLDNSSRTPTVCDFSTFHDHENLSKDAQDKDQLAKNKPE